MADRFYISPTADSIPFDNDTNGFTADNVQDAIEEVQGDKIGKLLDFIFTASGNTADKWLGVGNGSTSSNTLPFIVPQSAKLSWLTFSNQDDNVDIDVEVYINGALLYTWLVRNKRTSYKTNLPTLAMNQGDRLSCFIKKYAGGTGDQTPQNPIIEVGLQLTDSVEAEGGTQNGV